MDLSRPPFSARARRRGRGRPRARGDGAYTHYNEEARALVPQNGFTPGAAIGGGGGGAWDAQPGILRSREVQYAFENWMTRGILRFVSSIAIRCVFHRCKSQDIRRYELWWFFCMVIYLAGGGGRGAAGASGGRRRRDRLSRGDGDPGSPFPAFPPIYIYILPHLSSSTEHHLFPSTAQKLQWEREAHK